MITVALNGESTDVYDVDEFPYHVIAEGVQRVERGRKKYWDIFGTFDIETTNMEKGNRWKTNWAFMYVWQFCINGWVVMGRTWEQYGIMLDRLRDALGPGATLVIYVHNLQFEFQFMRNFFKFDNVFCRKKRMVMKCEEVGIEYRCSYLLTNMGLDKFLKKQRGVHWFKQVGRFDYRKIRWPDTVLSLEEILYCVCDVLGLWEGIKSMMLDNQCDVATIPLTSTGFVRKDYRDKCLSDRAHMKRFERGRLNSEQYILLGEASRGAISGSNAIYTGWTIDCVDSFDIKSSYPYQMATKYYPTGRFGFTNYSWGDNHFLDALLRYCCVIVWCAENFKLKQWNSIPYIAKAKCKYVKGGMCGNGKVYAAKEIGMACTEVDLRLIQKYYTFDNPVVYKMMVAERGMLSKAFREHLMEMFQCKTDLEGGDKYLYDKYKNKINASFGMMLTDILHPEFVYDSKGDEPFATVEVEDFNEGLDKYYKNRNSFLSYQDGVWVLAHGRDSLCEGMDIVGEDIVQNDTDSVKCVGNYQTEFDALNDGIIEMAEDYDVKPYAVRRNGEKVYLGVWEHEKLKTKNQGVTTYQQFRTLGAKKYCYTDWDDEMHITVAGLGKEVAREWIQDNGGMKLFKPGVKVPEGHCGRLVAYYNDMLEPITMCIDGHFVTYGSNICMLDGSYTFGVTDEWEEMIAGEADWEIDEDNAGVGEGYLG